MDNLDKNQLIMNNEKKENNLNINNIKFEKDIIKDSYSFYSFNYSFIIFESIDKILYLIYSNNNNSIVFYDLIKNQIITKINNPHNKSISNFRHILDIINKRDLIISVSADDNNIKLWNIKNFECLYNYENVNNNGYLYSACFLNDNNNNYIITTNCAWKGISEPIKFFDFNGNKIKEINNSKEKTYFIDILYDKKLSKNYLITGNEGCIRSYNCSSNNIYRIYNDNDKKDHDCIVVYNDNEEIKLIDSSDDGNIRIWNFHSAKLIKKIKICDCDLYGMCLWNNDYLFFGCEEKLIKIIDLKKGIIIDNLKGHNNWVITMKKINHPEYGECLISQDSGKGQIKLWVIKNNI